MTDNSKNRKRLYVLDTNVLIHDPACFFRFQEHDLFLPMVVIEELDNNKRGHSEVARSARQASRFIEEIMQGASRASIEEGLALPTPVNELFTSGRLFLQTRMLDHALPSSLPGKSPDNSILATILALQNERGTDPVVLVSKDINMRIKAAALGIAAEDFHNDQVLDDLSLLYTGQELLPADFWEHHGKALESWKNEGRTFYRLRGPQVTGWYSNQLIYDNSERGFEGIVRSVDGDSAIVEICTNYRTPHHTVWGVNARNREQNFALNLLMNPEIDFVTL
ncbi:MAG: PhoH-like ATPase, partial [Halothiobacillaceae bacterium]